MKRWVLAVAVLCLTATVVGAQETDESHDGHHKNHFGGMVGVTTHHDANDSGFTLGLEYGRVLRERMVLAAYLEMVDSDLERDVIVAAGFGYYVTSSWSLILALGAEQALKEHVDENDEIERENEFNFMIRIGTGYVWPVTETATIGPVIMVDHAGDRVSSVVSVGFVVGF